MAAKSWFYLSFAREGQFVGACMVEALNHEDAPRVAREHGIDPGSDVAIIPAPGPGLLPPYRLFLAPAPAAPWWREFARRDVLTAIEEAAAQALDVNDPLPDTLIAVAQSLALQPVELRMWIYDDPHRTDWSRDALTRWAKRYGLARAVQPGAQTA